MNIKMPRPNLASISINNNSRFDSEFITQRLIYVRCINILKSMFYVIITPAVISTPPAFFSRIFNKLRIFSVPVFRVPD